MSRTLFHTGLWIVVAVLAAFVLRLSFPESLGDVLHDRLLTQAGVLGLLLLAVSIPLRLAEKAAGPTSKKKCKICGRPVIAGKFYCREHLRELMAEEEERERSALRKR